MPCSGQGRQTSEVTNGEVSTLLSIMLKCEPDDIAGFVVITARKCPECGTHVRYQVNKDMDDAAAVNLLTQTIGAMVTTHMLEAEEATPDADD